MWQTWSFCGPSGQTLDWGRRQICLLKPCVRPEAIRSEGASVWIAEMKFRLSRPPSLLPAPAPASPPSAHCG